MKRTTLLVLLALLAVKAAIAQSADEAPRPKTPFEYEFGIYLQGDAVDPDPDDATAAAFDPQPDSGLRRARPTFELSWRDFELKIEGDLASGEAVFTDVYLRWKSPLGGVQIGHFKEPFGLEETTSSKSTAFIERSLGRVFSPVRNSGVLFHDLRGFAPEPGSSIAGDRLFWAAGAFRESPGLDFESNSGDLNLTGRVAWLPLYRNEGSQLVHLGLTASRKDPGDGTIRFRQRPSVRFAPRFVDTGSFAAESVDVVAFEWAVIRGRFWASGEYFQAAVENTALLDPTFDSAYAQAGWFITGEARPYSLKKAAFGGVKPRRPLFGGGAGAFEAAVRFSDLDLDDGAIAGGGLEDWTLGLNWYPTSETRFMINYVKADRDGVGDSDFLSARFQFTVGFN